MVGFDAVVRNETMRFAANEKVALLSYTIAA